MDEHRRRELLDRIDRPSRTVGGSMPEELTVDGTTVDLRALVFECERLETIPEAERERVEDAKRTLRRERLRRKQRVAREELDVETAEELVESVHGIDRALTALEGLDEPSFGEAVRRERLDDARELMELVRL
jgi:hypothetical protein